MSPGVNRFEGVAVVGACDTEFECDKFFISGVDKRVCGCESGKRGNVCDFCYVIVTLSLFVIILALVLCLYGFVYF